MTEMVFYLQQRVECDRLGQGWFFFLFFKSMTEILWEHLHSADVTLTCALQRHTSSTSTSTSNSAFSFTPLVFFIYYLNRRTKRRRAASGHKHRSQRQIQKFDFPLVTCSPTAREIYTRQAPNVFDFSISTLVFVVRVK